MFGDFLHDAADDFGVVVHEVDACLVGSACLSSDDDDEFAALHLAVVAGTLDSAVELDCRSGLHHVERFAFCEGFGDVDENYIVHVIFEDIKSCLAADSSCADNSYHNNQEQCRVDS